MAAPLRIVDAHVHLYDHQQHHHAFLDQADPGYEAFVGNYDALPRRFLLDDYLAQTRGYRVDAIVWHEFLSDDPCREAAWAQQLADAGGMKHALVARVDFLDPSLEATLEHYESLSHVTAVREHMAWDERQPLRRFARRPDLLRDPSWRKRLRLLDGRRFKCGLEVFASQLGELAEVVWQHPHIGFTIGVMGWPDDTGAAGFERWRKDLAELAACGNTCLDISALECIFGMAWSADDAGSWVDAAIDTFGVSRCMFGSHLPVSTLSTRFARLYERYDQLTRGCSPHELDELFYGVAQRWFAPK
jgi:predicted TIM-barrel fold metal-dependent hydrolase